MNKNVISIILVLGVLVLAGIGYAAWNASKSSQVASPNPTTNTTTTTSNPTVTLQPGLPTVQTDSTVIPYISTVLVKGTVNPNGPLTTYWYEYGLTSALGTKTSGYLAGSGYTGIYAPAYITGLLSNTNYYFRLSASNDFGIVTGATYSFKTTTTPAPNGIAPTTTTIAATDITRTTANFHGKINPNGSETTFWFEYGTTSQFGVITAFQSAGSDGSALSFSISVSNLQPLTKYYFRLNAQNQFGTVNGQILNFTTLGPIQPFAPIVTTASATAVTDSSAKLNADIKPNGAVTTYWFEYSSDVSLSSALVNTLELSLNDVTLATNVSVNIDNLNNNTKYYYRVVAKNQYGTVRGSIKSFTTKK